MKAVTVFFNIAIEEEVLAAVRGAGVEHYSEWPRMTGRGAATGARMDNHVWPGANSGILMLVDDKVATTVMDALQKLRDSRVGHQSGIFAYQSPVERTLK